LKLKVAKLEQANSDLKDEVNQFNEQIEAINEEKERLGVAGSI
jgi:cell division protein FtsB